MGGFLDRRRFLVFSAGAALAGSGTGACSAPRGRESEAAPDGPPRRKSYTFPRQAEPLAKGLQEAGIAIVYGPNSVPAPPGISDAARQAWANQPQLPLPADDPAKLAAVRAFSAATEDAEFAKRSATHGLEDRTLNGIPTLWVTPRDLRHPDTVMMFIHGGAWIVNSRRTQLALQCAVADSLGVPVVSVEYRLAPEHPYPAALDDVLAAYSGLVEDFRPGNIGVFGTSAGGGLALAALLGLKARGLPSPAAAAPLSPGADMTHSGYLFGSVGLNDPILTPYDVDLAMRAYVGGADPRNPLVSPVFGDYTGAPPLFLLATTGEIIGSDAIRVAERARAQGAEATLVVSDGMWHVPIADGTGIPELQGAYDQMIGFFRRHLRV